jgi:hypothetical protein
MNVEHRLGELLQYHYVANPERMKLSKSSNIYMNLLRTVIPIQILSHLE